MRNTVWSLEEAGGAFVKQERTLAPLEGKQVLVRIAASGINPLDTKIRGGKAAHAQQHLPAVLGLDMAGTVEEVGPGVNGFKPGDEVYGMAGGVGGLQGTLAEFIVADSDLLALKPRSLSMRQAAAMPLVTITAWEGLVDRANVRVGQTALIHGGSGGIGHMAIQIARAKGAKVFATVSVNKILFVQELGATPIDYQAMSPPDYMQKYTDGRGFDIVFDTVGGATLDASFQVAKRYTGHVLSALGWGSHSLAPLSFRGATYSGVFTLYPMLSGEGRSHHGEILKHAAAMADTAALTPLLNERRFSPAEIHEAFAAVEAGSTGKVVVEFGL
jgi:NADPH2:quinone reductase